MQQLQQHQIISNMIIPENEIADYDAFKIEQKRKLQQESQFEMENLHLGPGGGGGGSSASNIGDNSSQRFSQMRSVVSEADTLSTPY